MSSDNAGVALAWMSLARRRRRNGYSASSETNAGSPGVVHLSVLRFVSPYSAALALTQSNCD
jgi:hypothetical protein